MKGRNRGTHRRHHAVAPVRRGAGLVLAAIMVAAPVAGAAAAGPTRSPAPSTAAPPRPVIVAVRIAAAEPVVDPLERARELAPGGASPILLPK